MRDELFDRNYADGRDALNEGIDRLLARVTGFLHLGRARARADWPAAWKRRERSRRSGLA